MSGKVVNKEFGGREKLYLNKTGILKKNKKWTKFGLAEKESRSNVDVGGKWCGGWRLGGSQPLTGYEKKPKPPTNNEVWAYSSPRKRPRK